MRRSLSYSTPIVMPTDARQYFYDCRHFGAVLKPLAGDCCVSCSCGDVPCLPHPKRESQRQLGALLFTALVSCLDGSRIAGDDMVVWRGSEAVLSSACWCSRLEDCWP